VSGCAAHDVRRLDFGQFARPCSRLCLRPSESRREKKEAVILSKQLVARIGDNSGGVILRVEARLFNSLGK
jgi:hypothetical protein